jgi:formylglycine-generating enzyme required for sulfatase activity
MVSAIAPAMVAVPGGRFLMGSNLHRPDERPRREVSVQGFLAGQSPVSNAEYGRFVTVTGAARPPFVAEERFRGEAIPAVGVSWEDAVAYCAWLQEQLGGAYRLPTEAEREWASLGGPCGSDWPWPGSMECHPIHGELATLDQPHVPTAACANGYGLRCMAENVHEWCLDWYAKDAYATCPPGASPASGTRRVARGGSWRHSTKFTRLTARASLNPAYRYNDFGFRVYADTSAGVG